jgi:ABC-type multidrug transport system ATPase subunit
MPDTENLRRRANLLLVLAQKARDDDYIKLAEHITERATQLFDEAIILERGKIQLAGALMADLPEHGH